MNISTHTYSIVIADDDLLIRESLQDLLSDHPALKLVGSADNGADAAKLCQRYEADLAVLDVMMPSGGEDALKLVKELSPHTMVVFYTAASDRRTRARLLDSGASAVFGKGATLDLAGDLHDLLIHLN